MNAVMVCMSAAGRTVRGVLRELISRCVPGGEGQRGLSAHKQRESVAERPSEFDPRVSFVRQVARRRSYELRHKEPAHRPMEPARNFTHRARSMSLLRMAMHIGRIS